MKLEGGIAAAFFAVWFLAVGLGFAYVIAIIWSLIKVTNHFAP